MVGRAQAATIDGTESAEPAGTEGTRLLVRVARMYYEEGLTHRAIAEELALSRVKVTRLLGRARELGIVRISVHDPERPSADVEMDLASTLGIREVRIAGSAVREDSRTSLAATAAAFLGEELPGRSVVAFGVSTMVADAVARMDARPSPHSVMVPLSGGWAGPSRLLNPDSSAGLCARRLGARAYAITAPLVAPDADGAASLIAHGEVASVLALARTAETVVMGIGVAPGEPTWSEALLGRAVSDEESLRLREADVAGDISGRFYDTAGRAVLGSFDDRLVGLSLAEIAAIPQRIAIAGGAHKAAAIRAAAAGGLVTSLVTDMEAAQALFAATA